MSEEEIKKKAREYAHLRAFDGGFFPKEDEIAEDFEVCLKLLTEDYCIVPKSKVDDWWKALMNLYVNGRESTLRGLKGMYKELFGIELTDNSNKAYQEIFEDLTTDYSTEIWRDVPGYEDLYQVSNLGNIKHKATKAIGGSGYYEKDEYLLTPTKKSNGYCSVCLYKKDAVKSFLVHRIVALAFIPNPNGYKCVNHINCKRDDNRVENLEWCTNSYNTRYAFAKGRMSKSLAAGRPWRKVKVVRLADEKEFVFDNMVEASEFVGVEKSTIRYHVLKGNSICNGYRISDFEQKVE